MSAYRAAVVVCNGCGYVTIVREATIIASRAALEASGWRGGKGGYDLCAECMDPPKPNAEGNGG